MKQPRWLTGVASVGSVSADPSLYPAGAEWRFGGKFVFLVVSSPHPRDKKRRSWRSTTSPILDGCRPLEKTVFGSLPVPRLNGVRSSVRKDVTRLLPVFRTCSPRRYSDSSPGAHSHFGVTCLACRPRDAMARVNCHANVDSMYEPFRFPYRPRSRWDLEPMFHSRLLPSLTRSFTLVTGFNYEERKDHPPMSAEVCPRCDSIRVASMNAARGTTRY